MHSIAYNCLAEELEREDAGLAVGLGSQGCKDGGLRDVGADGHRIGPRVKSHIIDEQLSNFRAVEQVTEGCVSLESRQLVDK